MRKMIFAGAAALTLIAGLATHSVTRTLADADGTNGVSRAEFADADGIRTLADADGTNGVGRAEFADADGTKGVGHAQFADADGTKGAGRNRRA